MSEAITKATSEQIAAGMRELFKDREQRYQAWEDVLQRIYGAMAALSQAGQGGQGEQWETSPMGGEQWQTVPFHDAARPAPAVPAALPSDMTDLADIAQVWACNPKLREFAATMQPKPSVPAGWQLVPVEPTDEMYEAGYVKLREIHSGPFNGSPSLGHAGSVWRDMLSAAPKPAGKEGAAP